MVQTALFLEHTPMKVLHVIHGYPMRYNAGSEVYTQTLCQSLADRHEVHVFTREEDSFGPDARLRQDRDPNDDRIQLHIVNNPRNKDRYRDQGIDLVFGQVLRQVRPEVVHIGHLNHLSTSLVDEAVIRHIPIVFTLHDFWLMCPRGQFMQMFGGDRGDVWSTCPGQQDERCATACYARYFGGGAEDLGVDSDYWAGWVARRMAETRRVAGLVDLFVAPSRHIRGRFLAEFGTPPDKLRYLDYGFDRARLSGRNRNFGEPFTFGYIGTHIPAKGIDYLIKAFSELSGEPRLRIWGRNSGQDTQALKALARNFVPGVSGRIEWLPEYRNQEIVRDVFNHVDAIVVPSIWDENSPLVIHEALQAGVPVVTADVGGMAEYVHHEVNGLLFRHRSVQSLADQMQRFVSNPEMALALAARGYIQDPEGDVPSIQDHVREIERIYEDVIKARRQDGSGAKGPWRITFDTNPDTCNLHCVMCEQHSHLRKGGGQPAPATDHRIMDPELIRMVVAEGVGRGLREIIPSTMGEPLLYPHFDVLLDACREFGVKMNLTTNGTFPRHGAEWWAQRIVPVTSDVKISWNGATKATQEAIMPGSRWEDRLAAVKALVIVRDAHAAAGGNWCRITFQVTWMESNVGELADIVRLAVSLGVDRLKGHHLWVHYPELENLSLRRNIDARRRWNRAVDEMRSAAMETELPGGRHILLDNVLPLKLDALEENSADGDCPFLGREAWINAQGRFDPCCAPDEQRKSLGRFGSIRDQGIMEIWGSDNYRQLVNTYTDREICRTCTMRRPCEVAI